MNIDPSLLAPEAISNETRRFNESLARLLEDGPRIDEMEPSEVRKVRRDGKGIMGPVVLSDIAETRTIRGIDGRLPIRFFRGDEVNGIYLHIHGGGFVLGAEDLQDPWNEAMAREAGVAVISVGYRLAPEHPYPAGADDCEIAAIWLVEHAEEEFGTNTLFIGGESAGAHLAVTTLVRMRDRHDFSGFSGANLVYGGYTVEPTPSTIRWDRGNLVLDQEIIAWFHRHAFPSDIDPTDPDAAPLYADLGDMPPALFTIGTLDPLLDNTLFMAARWTAAGSEAELIVYPGGVHAFDAFPTEIGFRARSRMHAWIDGRIRATAAAIR